jgi:hypothetical protein|tara:strand:- start:8357 stop:9004 length:648 start_codon:yes stop_codon:yes gene_type:complete
MPDETVNTEETSEESTLLTEEKGSEESEHQEEETTSPPESKESGDDSQESEDGKADEGQKDGAPEEYQDFKLPTDVAIDEKLVAEFTPIAKELNLTQEQAQKLVDLQVKNMQEFVTTQQKTWGDLQESWVSAVKADDEIGGTSFDENLSVAQKALDAFGSSALREVLDTTGAGNHPELVRFFYKVGKALSEDTLHQGGATSAPKTQAEIMYPTMN